MVTRSWGNHDLLSDLGNNVDFDLWSIAGSNVRASKNAAGARKKTLS